MTLIVCVDDRMGMAFNQRRQSRDRLLIRDLVEYLAGQPLGLDERSVPLFEDTQARLVTGRRAKRQDFYFLEFESPSGLGDLPDTILLYRWNRHYGADTWFDLPLTEYKLTETKEFPGSSHDMITREVYVHE